MKTFKPLNLCFYFLLLILNITAEFNLKKLNEWVLENRMFDHSFRLLSHSDQIGSSSLSGSTSGSSGLVKFINNKTNLNELQKIDYNIIIVFEDSIWFKNNIHTLLKYSNVKGFVFIEPELVPEQGFSSDKKCPNSQDSCSPEWNIYGNSLKFMDFGDKPLLLVKNESAVAVLRQCDKINNNLKSFTCSMSIYTYMFAVMNAETCLRRSSIVQEFSFTTKEMCQVLSGVNLFLPSKAKAINEQFIIVSVRLDTFSLFENVQLGANNPISSIVTLLSVVQALKPFLLDKAATATSVLFCFFDGEAFQYIGSSRTAYDLKFSKFADATTYLQLNNYTIDDIKAFLEISQIGNSYQSRKLWLHSTNHTASEFITKALLNDENKDLNIGMSNVQSKSIPPASVSSFLKYRQIPHLIIADHETSYTNKYYNSMYDTPKALKMSNESAFIKEYASYISDLSTVIARALVRLASEKENVSSIQADKKIVEEMVSCFYFNPECDLFFSSRVMANQQIMIAAWKKGIAVKYWIRPFYVGVSSFSNFNSYRFGQDKFTQELVLNLLQYFSSETVNSSVTKKECEKKTDEGFKYLMVYGPNKGNDTYVGACLKSAVTWTEAYSPGFKKTDGFWSVQDSTFSTWVESVWEIAKVAVYLESNENITISIFIIGLTLFIIVTVFTGLFVRFGHLIFPNH